MDTAVIGYPRIGKDRELKFAAEKFFRGEIDENQLQSVASAIRKENLLKQKEEGITYISSNDFSFYDNVLDTAFLFNIIPQRYKDLNLSSLETYFAMARGYQGAKGNVKALAMKKWFNTNYHYLVPQIDDDTRIELTGTKPVDEYLEAKSFGVDTKPSVVGPFTFLKLAKFTGNKTVSDVYQDLTNEYIKLVASLASKGAELIEFDEPYLVRDLSNEDIDLFKNIYAPILSNKNGAKILLQTYFGDVRDIYDVVTSLDFDAVGLDFIEGRKTAQLVKENGFPDDKILFAGVVNGKNIWRNNYKTTLALLTKLNAKNVVVNTSCSLLHVPYSLKSETKLKEEYRKHFAFAEEKLSELNEI
ncbi:MAG: 5-methyltetrahydropteroyltriglutamate--homocysteine S-methyltransferase, partial [Clostridiales bacterium]|nr:5-methyltetrahydropteroyltriglutamate--homocysteine S-methyltransferase [Clostridiales bacterium]